MIFCSRTNRPGDTELRELSERKMVMVKGNCMGTQKTTSGCGCADKYLFTSNVHVLHWVFPSRHSNRTLSTARKISSSDEVSFLITLPQPVKCGGFKRTKTVSSSFG